MFEKGVICHLLFGRVSLQASVISWWSISVQQNPTTAISHTCAVQVSKSYVKTGYVSQFSSYAVNVCNQGLKTFNLNSLHVFISTQAKGSNRQADKWLLSARPSRNV